MRASESESESEKWNPLKPYLLDLCTHTGEWIMYWKLREKKSVVVERQKGGGWIDDIDMLLLVTRFNSSTKYYFNTVIFIILPNIGLLPFPSMDSLREKGKEDGYNKDRLLVAFNFYESGKRSTKEWMLKTRHVALCFTFHGMSFPWVSFFFFFFLFSFFFSFLFLLLLFTYRWNSEI